jgi:toxin-antitoxin system PIN domain toxin
MTLLDANLLLYAEDQTSPHHTKARQWWEAQLSGTGAVCLSWPVISAFMRITTNARIVRHPLTIGQAVDRVNEWLVRPCVRVVAPTDAHWDLFEQMLRQGQAGANLVNDAHLAALAIEHGCELCSADADFARFPRLRWRNPLA